MPMQTGAVPAKTQMRKRPGRSPESAKHGAHGRHVELGRAMLDGLALEGSYMPTWAHVLPPNEAVAWLQGGLPSHGVTHVEHVVWQCLRQGGGEAASAAALWRRLPTAVLVDVYLHVLLR